MSADPVLYACDESGIATITLNLPEQRNPISDHAVIDALLGVLAAMEADPAVRVAILTGAGSAFSAGGNLKAMRPDSGGLKSALPARTRGNYKRGIQRIPLAFAALEVPVIAAVNGPAIGAGLDLACMCDLRIAADNAVFAESFVKLGIIPGDGGAWLLPRIVGFSKAAELTLTGETIDAAEALAIGLVSRVVPAAQLLAAAHALAARIAANPGFAVRMAKRMLWDAQRLDLGATLELAAAMQAVAHATADNEEAVEAFLAKRKPVFRGD
ncbi:crotonase/enoyl-CoA hydratase family protein [Parablastomonas sp. CN1-191]|uniref:crotonase/enoyl-CoA hydratase family protein n=1 Tax=Parablastomonas sp. CN1-191 TaxID=3400908 RepID=UPI003BF82B61